MFLWKSRSLFRQGMNLDDKFQAKVQIVPMGKVSIPFSSGHELGLSVAHISRIVLKESSRSLFRQGMNLDSQRRRGKMKKWKAVSIPFSSGHELGPPGKRQSLLHR